MKSIIKTIGAISLMDPQTKEFITNAPRVAVWSHFLEARTGKGQLKVLAADLPKEATDEDFQAFLAESDQREDLAVASFVSQFLDDEDEDEKEPDPVKSQERIDLEAKAGEMGVKFRANITDEKLTERVADATKASAEAREALELKAIELEVAYTDETSDVKLAELISAAVAATEA
jgi:hypothetical protein